jgi:hypothetical protein
MLSKELVALANLKCTLPAQSRLAAHLFARSTSCGQHAVWPQRGQCCLQRCNRPQTAMAGQEWEGMEQSRAQCSTAQHSTAAQHSAAQHRPAEINTQPSKTRHSAARHCMVRASTAQLRPAQPSPPSPAQHAGTHSTAHWHSSTGKSVMNRVARNTALHNTAEGGGSSQICESRCQNNSSPQRTSGTAGAGTGRSHSPRPRTTAFGGLGRCHASLTAQRAPGTPSLVGSHAAAPWSCLPVPTIHQLMALPVPDVYRI